MVVSVAVLGCGPGGMSFCHAAETLRQQESREKNTNSVNNVLDIFCFEKSSTPGGVWKAANPGKETVNMYAALWTNGPSHCTEYFDYTYDEHFHHKPITVYMQRQDVLGYMVARVTKHCPNFFEKYVQFNTAATHVVYNKKTNQFDITLQCQKTFEKTVRHFDKCVWACGQNSRQRVPNATWDLFQRESNNGFKGRVIHSADTENLKEDVQGKRILLLGGGYSAEDLALQAIKLGVKKVYISTRSTGTYVSYEEFPMKKVKVLQYSLLTSITENGNCLNFQKSKWTWPNTYAPASPEIVTQLRDIDTVIFCTGYKVNLDMLDESLNKGYPKWELKHDLQVPDSWKMPPNNVFSKLTGDNVKTGQVLHILGYCHPEFYRGVLISNPNMMFITMYESYFPLLAVDASAWMLVGFLTGRIQMPTREEMQKKNYEQALCELKVPYMRYYMDSNYCEAVNNAWNNELYSKASTEFAEYTYKLLARDMQEAGYPLSLGNYQELNEKCRALSTFSSLSSQHRYRLTKEYMKEHPTTTYRDCDDCEKFYSIFTGTGAVPLPKQWLDIDTETDKSFEDEVKLDK